VITLPKTVPPKTVSERLDLSFGIFARRGEKYSCYVFGFVRGQSPRYICCVKTGRDYKFQTTFGAVGRILESDILNLNRFNNFSDDLPFEKVV